MTPDRSRRIALALAAAATLAVASAATVLADSPAPGSAAPAAGSPGASGNGIEIIQKTFQPSSLAIHTGDTVTWTVTQAIADSHSVTSGSYKDTANAGKVFDSGIKLKNNGDSFSFKFTSAGTYTFFCEVHPDTMSGTITVTDASGSSGGATSDAIPTSSKVIAAVVLVVVLLLLFGWARVYRRMNPA